MMRWNVLREQRVHHLVEGKLNAQPALRVQLLLKWLVVCTALNAVVDLLLFLAR